MVRRPVELEIKGEELFVLVIAVLVVMLVEPVVLEVDVTTELSVI